MANETGVTVCVGVVGICGLVSRDFNHLFHLLVSVFRGRVADNLSISLPLSRRLLLRVMRSYP